MSTQVYQAYKYESNKGMQDINKRQREREQSQTQGICFEVRAHLLYIPAFDTTKDFYYARSQWITPRCRNTYKPSDSLVPYTRKPTCSPRPHLKQRVRTWTRNTESTLGPETMRTQPSAFSKEQRTSLWWSQYIDHLKTISLQHSYRMSMSMNCSSVCEKTRMRMVEEKLKKNLF